MTSCKVKFNKLLLLRYPAKLVAFTAAVTKIDNMKKSEKKRALRGAFKAKLRFTVVIRLTKKKTLRAMRVPVRE